MGRLEFRLRGLSLRKFPLQRRTLQIALLALRTSKPYRAKNRDILCVLLFLQVSQANKGILECQSDLCFYQGDRWRQTLLSSLPFLQICSVYARITLLSLHLGIDLIQYLIQYSVKYSVKLCAILYAILYVKNM